MERHRGAARVAREDRATGAQAVGARRRAAETVVGLDPCERARIDRDVSIQGEDGAAQAVAADAAGRAIAAEPSPTRERAPDHREALAEEADGAALAVTAVAGVAEAVSALRDIGPVGVTERGAGDAQGRVDVAEDGAPDAVAAVGVRGVAGGALGEVGGEVTVLDRQRGARAGAG